MQEVCVYPNIEGAELAERAHRVVLDLSLGSLVCLGMYKYFWPPCGPLFENSVGSYGTLFTIVKFLGWICSVLLAWAP